MANGDHSTTAPSTTGPSHGKSTNANPYGDGGPRRPAQHHNDTNNHPASSSSWGWILLALLLVILIAGTAWFIYAHYRARRLGISGPRLNPFSDRNRIPGSSTGSGGLVSWVQEKFAGLRRQRTAGGAYEGTTGDLGASGRRGRGMDPDEAWDTRMGTEADVYGGPVGFYEEQEYSAGVHDDSAYAGGGYGRPTRGYGPPGGLDEIELGETRGRKSELDERYDEETGRKSNNPFDDHAEPSNVSLRGVSPRPHAEDSPTERKSMFKENV